MPKEVCIMTSVHRHDDVRIYHKSAKSLKAAGYDVTVLCSDYEGIDSDGIRFVRVDVPKGRMKRIMKAGKLFYKKALALDCDIYHFHDPELMGAGVKLAKQRVAIYDIHEDVPRQILTKPYLKPVIARLCSCVVEWYETRCVKRLSGVICAEPIIYDRIGPLNRHSALVCNYPKLEEFEQACAADERTNAVCYIGGITRIRGIFEMLEAVQDGDIKLILAGDFEDEALKAEVEQHKGYKNVDYRGFVGRDEVRGILSSVKAGLVTLNPIPKYLTALPVKMFEYMVAEVPVIASNFPYWKAIVDDAGCGVCVDPMVPGEVQSAIQYIVSNPDQATLMGQRGRVAVNEKYNWGVEKQKLLSLYDGLLNMAAQ